MLVEIFCKFETYAKFIIDYKAQTLDIIQPPDTKIRFINSIFTYTDGFRFDFKTVSTYLKNRGINADTKTGVYYNVDSPTAVVILRSPLF